MKKTFYTFLFLLCFFFSEAQEPITVAINDTIPPMTKFAKKRNPLAAIDVSGGYSYWFMDLPLDIYSIGEFYTKKLQHGFNVGINLNFFVCKSVAFGVKYSLFRTKNEINDIIYNVGKGDLIDHVFIHYIAPSVLLKFGDPDSKVFFVLDGSLGCLFYRNMGVDYYDFVVKGAAFGINLVPGIELKISDNFFVNYRIGGTIGTMNKYTVKMNKRTYTIDDNKERLTRLDFSIGFRWSK